MGRQKYQKLFVLPDQTAYLAIPELAVIKENNSPVTCYEVVHQRYFSRSYPICPKCGGINTRPLKVVDRQLKDIVGKQEKASDVIDLIFHIHILPRAQLCRKPCSTSPESMLNLPGGDAQSRAEYSTYTIDIKSHA